MCPFHQNAELTEPEARDLTASVHQPFEVVPTVVGISL
jgi:hypothetical protein